MIHILDTQLRLITPTDLEDHQTEPGNDHAARYYQLTHDYLVPSLREWLTRKQKETRRGRAELCLAERSAAWNARPDNRHLPNVYEWLNIRFLTDVKAWSNPQQMMMRKAARIHATYWGIIFAVLLASGILVTSAAVNYEDRIRAEEKFQHAKRLFDNSFLLISEDRLLKEPGFETLRKRDIVNSCG